MCIYYTRALIVYIWYYLTMTIGTQIKKYRIQSNLTLEALANKLDLTKGAIASWEKDRQNPTVSNMQKLVKIFGIGLGDLIDESGDVRESIQYEKPQKAKANNLPGTSIKQGELIPILDIAKSNGTDFGKITKSPIGHIAKPSALSNHKGLYAVYVSDSGMSPVHEAGDLRVVTPHIPCRSGDTVICVVFDGKTGQKTCYIKKFESIELSKGGQELVVLRQLNPVFDISFDKKNIEFMHKMLTYNEVLGL